SAKRREVHRIYAFGAKRRTCRLRQAHVDADADDDESRAGSLTTQVNENAAELRALVHDVVRPLECEARKAETRERPQSDNTRSQRQRTERCWCISGSADHREA